LQYITLKRLRDRRHCLTERSHNQTRSLSLSSPSSLAIIRQLESIESQHYFSTDWTRPKSLLRYTVSSVADKGISLLRILGDGGLGLRDILPRDPRTPCGLTWRPLGSRLTLLQAPSWAMHQIAGSGEASSGEARRRFALQRY
jgi:hypothetical protein